MDLLWEIALSGLDVKLANEMKCRQWVVLESLLVEVEPSSSLLNVLG